MIWFLKSHTTVGPAFFIVSNEKTGWEEIHHHKGCPSKFWFDSEQKSWILKVFYASCSAGNPGRHWIIGLKIKSYYQTLPLWWKLNQEKAVLFS